MILFLHLLSSFLCCIDSASIFERSRENDIASSLRQRRLAARAAAYKSEASLHPFRRFHPQQRQSVFDRRLGRDDQSQLRASFCFVIHQNVLIVIEAVERLRDVHDMSGDDGRLIPFACIDDDLRQLIDQLCQICIWDTISVCGRWKRWSRRSMPRRRIWW